MRWVKMRFMTKSKTTPAATKIWAAIAMRMFVERLAYEGRVESAFPT